MENWCDNTVRFTGEPTIVTTINKLFSKMEKDQEKGCFQLPRFITAENRLMTDLSVQPDYIYYRTRCEPNLQALQQIADHFNAGFVNRYAEPGTYLWGQATYANAQAENIDLDRDDLKQFSYDSELACYHYNGKTYDDNFDVLTDMLDDKIQRTRASYQLGR